jgi:Contractile injection system tube protein/LysM domain
MGLTKAQLYNADTGRKVVDCHFNPDEISISKSNKWEPAQSSGSSLPDVHFQGEGARSLTLTLLFDSYEQRTDVRQTTRLVQALMDAPEQRNASSRHTRPPHVMFRWGSFETFPAVITQLSQKFTLFMNTGMPVRATLSLTLQEVPQQSVKNQSRGQNPTSRAAGAQRVRTVQPGDTLDLIAHEELGDPTQWRRVAEANHLDDPRRLRSGLRLLIPGDV